MGVAGATGYAGIELVRRLARHPGAELTVAMASSASEARRIPALARIWDEPVQPLDVDVLAQRDAVFLALPETLSAELGPTIASKGARVFDLSGAYRLRESEVRERWYPDSRSSSVPVTYGLTVAQAARSPVSLCVDEGSTSAAWPTSSATAPEGDR